MKWEGMENGFNLVQVQIIARMRARKIGRSYTKCQPRVVQSIFKCWWNEYNTFYFASFSPPLAPPPSHFINIFASPRAVILFFYMFNTVFEFITNKQSKFGKQNKTFCGIFLEIFFAIYRVNWLNPICVECKCGWGTREIIERERKEIEKSDIFSECTQRRNKV